MPIDPSIPLQIRPIQPPDILGAYAKAGQLQALAQARQVRQQEMAQNAQTMQLNEMKLQEAQQDFQDQQTMRQSYIDAAGDPDKMIQIAAGRGVGPKMLTATQMSLAQMKEARAKLTKEERAAQDATNDQLHGLLQPVLLEKDPVKQKALWDQALSESVRSGLTTPEMAAQHPYPGPDGVRNYGLSLNTTKWLTAEGDRARGEAATGNLNIRQQEFENKQTADQIKAVAVRLGAAKNQAEYDKTLAELGAKMPYAVLKQFEGKTPQQAQMLGMTAAEQQKAQKEPTETENEAHWIATVNNPESAPADKAAAEANLRRQVQQRRATQQPQGGVTLMVPNQTGGYTATRVTPGQTVAPGAVTVPGMNSMNVPTASTRTMVETAPKVLGLVGRIKELLDANEKELGPLAGRWSEFTAGKVGLPNRGYTQLRTDAALLQTALMRMHVGARGGQQMMEHFKSLVDVSMQDPQNLRGSLEEIEQYAKATAAEGGPKGTSAPATETRPQAMGGYQIGHVYADKTYLGGDPNNGSSWRKAR